MGNAEKTKKKYYNNGVVNKMIKDGDPVPEGFVLGMCRRSKEDIEKSNAKRRKTNLEKYGPEAPLQSEEIMEKTKKTNLAKYGVENVSCSDIAKKKRKDTFIKKYGAESPMQGVLVQEKAKQTLYENYGVTQPMDSDVIKSRVRETNISRYGVPWNLQSEEVRIGSNNSAPNMYFESLLDNISIPYEREYTIGKYSYDFKVGNILVEIDPTATHNILWNPFGEHKGLDENYHRDKSMLAEENGFQCIHVFDWDNLTAVLNLLNARDRVYARKCSIKEVPIEDTTSFLVGNHMQGSCRGQEVRLGLYYAGVLVSVMTFGKPRYNKRYEWELLRYCSVLDVIGGAEKLFEHFKRGYSPKSVISYCDRSKFIGLVYGKLGFVKKNKNTKVSKHWYSIKEKKHITDNLLRYRGYDQLFHESYGKGSSNEELIIAKGYLPVCDCGQDTWVYIS